MLINRANAQGQILSCNPRQRQQVQAKPSQIIIMIINPSSQANQHKDREISHFSAINPVEPIGVR
ncbi:unnamed protein product [Periconia digitata]|uniref:Uncharacterized protein n=1 Tax=Periconia digitata TaxID=1303443 RepID=A0A9W4XTJ8_9PLEO|nr:unnamed protein product [Periconia digitata]